MEKYQNIAALFLVAAGCSAILASGCGQSVSQKQTDGKESVIEPATQSTEEENPKNKEENETIDFANASSNFLIDRADKALRKNDLELAQAAIAEVRSRNNVGLGGKMEIARILFGAGKMKGSAQVYDEVLKMRPDLKEQLWQRGLALYYAEEFEKGVDQFDTHQTYNSQDVENSVWQLLCQSRLTSVEEARKSMIPIDSDPRIPMKQVFDMFAGSGSPKEVIAASGYDKDNIVRNFSTYHGWLYVGLFHEMMGDQAASIEAMKTALKCQPVIAGLMGNVAEGHLRARNAYPSEKDPQ